MADWLLSLLGNEEFISKKTAKDTMFTVRFKRHLACLVGAACGASYIFFGVCPSNLSLKSSIYKPVRTSA